MAEKESPEDELHRRQEELAKKLIQSAMPNVQETIRRVLGSQLGASAISESLTSSMQCTLKDLTERMISRIEFPALRLDYNTLFPDLAGLNKKVAASLLPNIEALHNLQREQFADLIATVRSALDSMLPPNWRGDDVHLPKNLESLLLDEGLPLAWVPPTGVLIKVFAAETAGERRRILGSNWRTIVTACQAELDGIENVDLKEYVDFAAEAADALADGRSKASQALSANLLDTILRRSFSTDSREAITIQTERPNIDDYPLRLAIVIGGIWGSHGEYRPHRGDAIPRRYSRHASAHGVSRHQYSRVNAVIALMHVVGLLKVMEVDLA